MTDGNRAPIDVDLRRIPPHLAINGNRLRGEGLVDFHQIEFLMCPACLLEA